LVLAFFFPESFTPGLRPLENGFLLCTKPRSTPAKRGPQTVYDCVPDAITFYFKLRPGNSADRPAGSPEELFQWNKPQSAKAALPVWEAQSLSLDEAIRIAPIEDFHGAIPLAILRKVILRRDYSQKALHLAQPR
jgi:hypothetical protein